MTSSPCQGDARRRSLGFSLLEVLIAIVVLSIGLLGLAGLQFSALRGNNQSYERSQAHLLAQEIADSMRVNRREAATGAFSIEPGVIPPEMDCQGATVTCTQAQAAAHDLFRWHRRMREILPGSTARIFCSTDPCAPGVMHSVIVIWDEYRKGLPVDNATATSCPPGPVEPNDANPSTDVFDEEDHLACVRVALVP
ncbi:type IV pilus modification protein PilV [Panacagrimonas sp.]|uniref:type IV pilus modification protein PilV n=1 Tax=Panacagrimonas sp. TaxID=2480088 RepID=UPI003B516016